jgi:hypothetical protein
MNNTSSEIFKKNLDKAFSQIELNTSTMSDLMSTKQGVKEEDVSEKWSEKYKRSIDCSHPKGFSQRAHCQGNKKKKSENKESTGSGSVGAFSAPVFGGNDEFWEKSRAESHLANKLKEERKPFKASPKVKMAKNQDGEIFRVGDEATTIDTKEKITINYLSQKDGGVKVGYIGKYGPEEIHVDGLSKIPKVKMKAKKTKTKSDDSVEKVEATEATGSGSVGAYSSPAMWAKSTNKKDWGPSRKTQYKGGKFVSVKNKCTKFPYCNQGDINALNITKNESVKEAIKSVSQKLKIKESVINSILEYEYEKLNKRNK